MANKDKIFINPAGSDNERRLAHVEAYALTDAIHWIETALARGVKDGVALSPGLLENAMKELLIASQAHTALKAYQETLTGDEDFNESLEKAKKVFAKTRDDREKGLI